MGLDHAIMDSSRQKGAHGDKLGSPSSNALEIKYGILKKRVINAYSQRSHPGGSNNGKSERWKLKRPIDV